MKKILGLVGIIGALSLNSCSYEEKKDMTLVECEAGNLRIVAEYHQNIEPDSYLADDYYTLKFYETGINGEHYVGQLRAKDTERIKGMFHCDLGEMIVDVPNKNGIYRAPVKNTPP